MQQTSMITHTGFSRAGMPGTHVGISRHALAESHTYRKTLLTLTLKQQKLALPNDAAVLASTAAVTAQAAISRFHQHGKLLYASPRAVKAPLPLPFAVLSTR